MIITNKKNPLSLQTSVYLTVYTAETSADRYSGTQKRTAPRPEHYKHCISLSARVFVSPSSPHQDENNLNMKRINDMEWAGHCPTIWLDPLSRHPSRRAIAVLCDPSISSLRPRSGVGLFSLTRPHHSPHAPLPLPLCFLHVG
jgi:hypothetical protein